MAIYHLTTKNIGRSSGRSATASAAYRSAEKIKDDQQGLTFNYKSRVQSVSHTEILAPVNAPEWATDRSRLWNEVERSEKRKDSRVAREVEVALPKELSREESIELARNFACDSFVKRGMVADVCIHDLGKKNPHAHIMLTTRSIDEKGFGQKSREWNKSELLDEWRKEWEQQANQALKKAKVNERIDHRTLDAQGIDRLPQKHKGVDATGYENRTGKPSKNSVKDFMRDTARASMERIRTRLEFERLERLEIEKAKEQKKRDMNKDRGMTMEM